MLSIIIPVKNEEELIKNSIDQLLNEMENIELELIVIDDFSNDHTNNIVEEISKKNDKNYSNFFYILFHKTREIIFS